MSYIKGKRILFFAPKFFYYEREIACKLCVLGGVVDYFDERPSNSVLLKAALRLNARSMGAAINLYYRNIINKIKNNSYDFVFVVNAEAITPEIVDELRMHFRNAKFVLYMWDSVRNKKNAMKLRHSFDCTYSFDRMDADKISEIKFRPLFFCDDYKSNGPASLKYDLVFAGTGHADRFAIIDRIKQQAAADGLSLYTFLYLHTRLMYLYQFYNDKRFRNKASIKYFSFTPLAKEHLIKILYSGKAVIDIQHPNQMGLTMRTFEVMGLDKKIITTNQDITSYDFYLPENIYVIDRANPYIEKGFLEIPFTPLSPDIKQQYSLESWLQFMLQ